MKLIRLLTFIKIIRLAKVMETAKEFKSFDSSKIDVNAPLFEINLSKKLSTAMSNRLSIQDRISNIMNSASINKTRKNQIEARKNSNAIKRSQTFVFDPQKMIKVFQVTKESSSSSSSSSSSMSQTSSKKSKSKNIAADCKTINDPAEASESRVDNWIKPQKIFLDDEPKIIDGYKKVYSSPNIFPTNSKDQSIEYKLDKSNITLVEIFNNFSDQKIQDELLQQEIHATNLANLAMNTNLRRKKLIDNEVINNLDEDYDLYNFDDLKNLIDDIDPINKSFISDNGNEMYKSPIKREMDKFLEINDIDMDDLIENKSLVLVPIQRFSNKMKDTLILKKSPLKNKYEVKSSHYSKLNSKPVSKINRSILRKKLFSDDSSNESRTSYIKADKSTFSSKENKSSESSKIPSFILDNMTPYSNYAESKSTVRIKSLKLIRPDILREDLKSSHSEAENKVKYKIRNRQAVSFKSTPNINLKSSAINFDKLTIDIERDTDVHTVNHKGNKRSSSPTLLFGRDSYKSCNTNGSRKSSFNDDSREMIEVYESYNRKQTLQLHKISTIKDSLQTDVGNDIQEKELETEKKNKRRKKKHRKPTLEESLTDLLTNKLVILVMVILIIVPILDVDYVTTTILASIADDGFYLDFKDFWIESLQLAVNKSIENPVYLITLNMCIDRFKDASYDGSSLKESNYTDPPLFYYYNFTLFQEYQLLKSTYNNTKYYSLVPDDNYEHPDFKKIFSSKRNNFNFVDHKYQIGNFSLIEIVYNIDVEKSLDSLLNVFKIIFISIVLLLGSYIFSQDIQNLVTRPLDLCMTRLKFYLSNTDSLTENIDFDNNDKMDIRSAYEKALILIDKNQGKKSNSNAKLETKGIDNNIKILINLISISIGKPSKKK
jgi:hypothetical protein